MLVQLQGDTTVFIIECAVTLYLLISQGIISEKFLMPSLLNISKRYNLPKGIAGVMVAFGIAVPELAVLMLCFQSHGIKMTEFGLATVFGGICFCVTFVPAFGYFCNFGLLTPRPAPNAQKVIANKKFFQLFVRDMSFTTLGLGMYYVIFLKGAIKLAEVAGLLLCFVLYILVVYFQSIQIKRWGEAEKAAQGKKFDGENEMPEHEEEKALLTEAMVNEPEPSPEMTIMNAEEEDDTQAAIKGRTSDVEEDKDDAIKEQEDANKSTKEIENWSQNADKESSAITEAEHGGHKHEPILEAIATFTCLVTWPLGQVLPVKAYPELALVLIFVVIYFMVEFIVTVMNVFSVYTELSHFFVGITLMVWGSDTLELLNMAIAIKNNEEELGLISVVSCQVLCLLLVIPVACIYRMYTREQTEIQVLMTNHTRNQVVLPSLFLTLLSFFTYWACSMHLNRRAAVVLGLAYVWYMCFAWAKFKNEDE